jgi:hypothetical protein
MQSPLCDEGTLLVSGVTPKLSLARGIHRLVERPQALRGLAEDDSR